MFSKAYLLLFVPLLLLIALSACVRNTPLPSVLPDLPAGWNRITPAGETICADGSEYAYFVNPGTVNKLVVDFDGGGACWNDATCSRPSNPENAFDGVYVEGVYGSPEDFGFDGIFDRENPANPFRDWYHVYISYCTADLHLGNNVASYTGEGGELSVNHKGAVNARAALDWIFDNFSAPETVFVTGLSAGAYAAIAWLPEVAEKYEDADIYQLGDSGAGVVTEEFFTTDAANWRLEGALPDLGDPIVLDENALTNLYTAVGEAYPDAVLSQYNTLFDGTQIAFYGLMQGVSPPTPELSAEWSERMTASLAAIAEETPNFRSYLSTLDVDGDPANGTTHVILNRPEFYTLETSGVRFVDWLGDLVNDRQVDSVAPNGAPPSALGDSPTVTGRIVNLDEAGLSGSVLELGVGRIVSVDDPDVLVTAPVAEDGAFSVQLPGGAEMTPLLVDARPVTDEGCDVTLTPEAYKTYDSPDFAFYEGGEPRDRLIYSSDLSSNFVAYTYVDRDVTVTGSCTGGMLAGITFDLDMREGWNTVVYDFSALEFRSERPGPEYAWLLPVCTIGCPPE